MRDHCHITGRYRGSAHQSCNLNYQLNDKIPVIFHNIIVRELGGIIQDYTWVDEQGNAHHMNIGVIPNNMEKYMAFTLCGHLVFIDSFQFMRRGLDKLVESLDKRLLKYTSREFVGEKFRLMTRKGVDSYDYMDSFNKFEERALPHWKEFYSLLKREHISVKDY